MLDHDLCPAQERVAPTSVPGDLCRYGARPWLVRAVAAAALIATGSFAAGTTPGRAAGLASAPVVFPGPSRGVPGSQTPGGGAFTTHCNANMNTDVGHVGGVAIPPGTAVEATTGCGAAVIPLLVPGAGGLHALFGIADDDSSGQMAEVRVHVLDQDGVVIGVADVKAAKGHAASIDLDLARAVAVEFDFLKTPTTFLYGVRLSGTARALAPAPRPAAGLPAGATPVNMAAVTYDCNMHAATASSPLTVTLAGIPTAGSATGTSCGSITLNIPSGTQGTLVLRYGADDSSSGGQMMLTMRVLDASGRLLRKAIGLAAVGTGLQPLWADVTGASTVKLTIEGSTTNVNLDITGIGMLPRSVAPYQTRNRVIPAGPPGAPAVVDPTAFVSKCNSIVGTDDVTVGHMPVLAGTYLATYSCGATSLFFCCTTTAGTFHARFGVPDGSTSGPRATITVSVNDKNNHLLRQRAFTATRGNPGVPIDVDVGQASTLSFAFGGTEGVLYGMRLSGSATISVHIFPSSAPPVEVPGGVPINPNDFTRQCNAYVATDDLRLVGATTLEGWALTGEACGEADLSLAHTHYPRHDFYARFGIQLGEPPNTAVTMIFKTLDAAGKVMRTASVVARYGYGPQAVRLSLAGVAKVQIIWGTQNLSGTVVYALTAR